MVFEKVLAKVETVFPIQQGVGAQSGKEWKKLEFLISTVDREYEKDGEKKQVTNKVKAALWTQKAEEFGQYIVEGNTIEVSGEVSTSEWNGKFFNEIRITNVVLVGGQLDPTVLSAEPAQQETLDDDSGLPF